MTIASDVVDLQFRMPSATDVFGLDTNILLWYSYKPSLIPKAVYRYQPYSSFIKSAVNSGSSFNVSIINLAELSHVIERFEWELVGGEAGQYGTIKDFRADPAQHAHVSGEVQAAWAVIMTLATVVDAMLPSSVIPHYLAEYASSQSDAYDGLLIEAYKSAGVSQLISGDADWATWAGINLFTANQRVVDAARIQSMLIP